MAILPVVKVNGKPKPELVLIDGKPRRSTGGTFYLGTHDLRRTCTKLCRKGGPDPA